MKLFDGHKTSLLLLGFVGCFMISGERSANADLACGTVTNVGSPPNSDANDAAPSISANGLELYFDSNRRGGSDPNNKTTDIWVSTRKTIYESWAEPVNINELMCPDVDPNNLVNTKYDEGQPDISGDGLSLYFHSTRPYSGSYACFFYARSGPSNIWVTRRKTKEACWEKPALLWPFVNSNCDEWDPNPSTSDGGLFFTRQLYYDADIWWWHYTQTGYCGIELPEPINSTANDNMPSISNDGLVLFFASTRAGGYGSYDLYKATRTKLTDPWSQAEVVNLGPCVNTAYADSAPSISSDGRVLYFSDWPNPRAGGFGGYDLWQASITAGGRIIYVDCNAAGNNDGTSWQNAFNYLQDALAAAQSCDEVWVAKGAYKPDQGAGQTPGNQNAAFLLKTCVAIYGGFPSGGGNWEDRDPNDPNNETILSGDLDSNDVDVTDPCDLLTELTRGENSYHVVSGSGTNDTAVLDGFTITGGNATGAGGGMYNDRASPTVTNCTFTANSAINYGGGMCNDDGSSPTIRDCTFGGNSAASGGGMCNDDGSSPTLTNCAFTTNSAQQWGGGIYNRPFNSNPMLTDCNFIGNSAAFGGGMCNFISTPTLTNCTFSGNLADANGAGMYNLYDSSPILTNCSFTANWANSNGGGMLNQLSSSPTLTNSTFTANRALKNGGAMYNHNYSSPMISNSLFICNLSDNFGGVIYNIKNSSPKLTNCTLTKNRAISPGGAIYNSIDSDPNLINCILWLDTPDEITDDATSKSTVTYSDIKGGWPGEGNIDKDPCFVDPNGPDDILCTEDDDLRLDSNSPCIDAGNSNAVPSGIWTDLDGNPRFVDDPDTADSGVGIPPIVDMGAYEFQDDVFKRGECYPQTYSTYGYWIAFGKPNCWCGMYGNPRWPYQCDGDCDGKTEGALKYRVFSEDLRCMAEQWKRTIAQVTNPCADFDHKPEGAMKYRVFSKDLGILVANWKKKDAQLPNCPRP